MNSILITGSAGFIGASLILRLLENTESLTIIGLDNMNTYYDPSLKEYRLQLIKNIASIKSKHNYSFVKGSISDCDLVNRIFEEYQFDIVVNLAAQAGVRHSIDNPDIYMESNMTGFYNILEACRRYSVKHLVYASSSSVYGNNKKVPFSVDDRSDTPMSLYAATKKSNELMAYCYSHLYDIHTTGLRFFTVYGPVGRPDMAYFNFTDKLLKGETIRLYNYGNCSRDFTYIDDAVESLVRVMSKMPATPYTIYNIGGGRPVNLLDFVQTLYEELLLADVLPSGYNLKQHIQLIPMQPGDVVATYADNSMLKRDFGFVPETTLREGLREFAMWYKTYFIDRQHTSCYQA